MDAKKRRALAAAGWKFGDVANFLRLSDDERQLLDARVEVARAVRRQREALHLSQQELALRIKTSQPRIVKIEQAASDVSLDQLVRAFTAAGGTIVVKQLGKGVARRVRRTSTANVNKRGSRAISMVRVNLVSNARK